MMAAPMLTQTPTLADVIVRLEADSTLAPERRRDLIGGVRFIAKALGRDPATLPAVLNLLRPKINALCPEVLGVSDKTLKNARANFLAALRVTGAIRQKGPKLTDEWARLRSLLPAQRLKNGLSRFL